MEQVAILAFIREDVGPDDSGSLVGAKNWFTHEKLVVFLTPFVS